MGSSFLGHITICSLDDINKDNRYWSSEPVYNKMKEISFCIHQETKDLETGVLTTSFANLKDNTDKSSFVFAKLLGAAFANKPVDAFFATTNSPDLDSYFRAAIATLEAGHTFSLWDGLSTKLPVSAGAISTVKDCYMKYNDFMNYPQFQPPAIPAPAPIPAPSAPAPVALVFQDIDDLEKRVLKLMARSEDHPVGPCTIKKPGLLPRSAPTAPIVIKTDDLEERIQRLLNLE